MTLIVTGRHNTLTPALREHAESKASQLARYFNLLQAVEVVVDRCRNGHRRACSVEMIATTRHRGRFVAKLTGDAYGCVDACFRKLERTLSDAKRQFKTPRRSVSVRGQAA